MPFFLSRYDDWILKKHGAPPEFSLRSFIPSQCVYKLCINSIWVLLWPTPVLYGTSHYYRMSNDSVLYPHVCIENRNWPALFSTLTFQKFKAD